MAPLFEDNPVRLIPFWIWTTCTLLFLLLSGCGDTADPVDREGGVGPLVVGGSLYSDFFEQVRSREQGGLIEMTVLGRTVTPLSEYQIDERFIAGQRFEGVLAESIGGQISAFVVRFGQMQEQGRSALQNKLSSQFGEPTAKVDTTVLYTSGLQVSRSNLEDIAGKVRERNVQIWEWAGQRVSLRLVSKFEGEINNLLILHRPLLDKSDQLFCDIHSTLQERQVSPKALREFPVRSIEGQDLSGAVSSAQERLGSEPLEVQRLDFKTSGDPFGEKKREKSSIYYWTSGERILSLRRGGTESIVEIDSVDREEHLGDGIYGGDYLSRLGVISATVYSARGTSLRPIHRPY
ncbi:hypothetical protein GGP66_002872 [Salinibacter ruber]|uniref:hypothetical protein n=1 Tax=Salinibacter ruber TaxID=146919 RepID=UPI002168712E|nr:hypothetical protein [Salinibacter ruber]MCS3675425.1 hypothetical protein [Salinibacter ruber]